MTLKQRIISMMEQRDVAPMSVTEWAEHLNMTSSDDFLLLQNTLKELEEDVEVVLSKKDRYILAEEAGVMKGTLSIHPKGFGFVDVQVGEDVYVSSNNMLDAMHKDEVIVRVNPSKEKLRDGEIIKVLKRNTQSIVGTMKTVKGKLWFIPTDERLKDKVIFKGGPSMKLVDGHMVVAKVTAYEPSIKVEAVRILGHENDPGVDVLSILLEKGIEPKFPQEVIDQANAYGESVDDIGHRRDLRDQMIITIDGEDAKDLDDAISIEQIENGYRLGVHIADVSHYVTENSPLDIEAYHRGTSVYVVDRVVPMLPHVLSNGLCSLNPHVDRYAISCVMEIDSAGEVTDYQIFPSVICSKYRMTYTKVNQMIDEDKASLNEYAEIVDMVNIMHECSLILRSRRDKLGSIDFEMDEAKIIIDDKGQIKDIQKRERFEAEKLIEDFMVLANECVARHTKWGHIPSLYRVHESPTKKKMQAFAKMASIMGYRLKGSLEDIHPTVLQKVLRHFEGDEKFPVISKLMLRSMQKAAYDPSPIGHFGLGLEDYTHFTSPIRRYPDLVVHRMLRKYVFDTSNFDKMSADEARLVDIAKQSSEKERNAVDAEREVEDMKKAEYMEKHVGMTAYGVISSVTKFGFFVELENTIEGLVHIQTLKDDYYVYDPVYHQLIGERTKKKFVLGQKVKIKVTGADKDAKTIDFRYLSEKRKRK